MHTQVSCHCHVKLKQHVAEQRKTLCKCFSKVVYWFDCLPLSLQLCVTGLRLTAVNLVKDKCLLVSLNRLYTHLLWQGLRLINNWLLTSYLKSKEKIKTFVFVWKLLCWPYKWQHIRINLCPRAVVVCKWSYSFRGSSSQGMQISTVE